VDRPVVLSVADAPNWAQSRFGVTAGEFELRVLRDALRCEHVGVSYLRFAPSWRSTVGHRHPGGEEVYVLVEGSARIKVEDDIFCMDAPAAVRVRGDQLRGIRPAGETPAVFVVAGYPIEDPDATEIVSNFWPNDE
jgi:mannose-6-phosphate isomerase-like protein (cupin superfamily)